jgi:hypothetical protein
MPAARIEITALEYLALAKLNLVGQALAMRLEGRAQVELYALTGVLRDVLARAEIARASAPGDRPAGLGA